MKTSAILAAALVLGMAGAASASTLAGDTVSVNLTADSDFGTQSVVVGGGEEANYFGNQFLDFNAGPGGDLFTIRSTSTFSSIDGVGGAPVVWTLTDLDFSDGKPLTGFEIVQNFSNASAVVTADSVTISYEDIAIPSGVYFTGRFVTDGVQRVPVPAALPLLAGALGGLALLRRRA